MLSYEKQEELSVIFRGKSITWRKDHLTAARNFLSASFKTNTKAEKDFYNQSKIKEKQKNELLKFSNDNNLWFAGNLSDSNKRRNSKG